MCCDIDRVVANDPAKATNIKEIRKLEHGLLVSHCGLGGYKKVGSGGETLLDCEKYYLQEEQ